MSDITSVIDRPDPPRQIHLRRMRLTVLDGPDRGTETLIDRDVVHMGTHPDNDLQLSDDTVSRYHAEIDHTQHGVVLRDLGSTNGTFVGDVRVREVYLGDRQRQFKLGQTTVSFRSEDEVVEIVPAQSEEFEGMVGRCVSMREMYSVVERVAPTDLTVLVTGETGTGKELVSRAIHARSKRSSGPFVVFDCGAVARNLIESELFGHERGAFTGAVAPRAGVFEQASGGTLFIDELGELPLELQPTLLRVLEQRQVRRVGDRRMRPIDVRVVAATHRDLLSEVSNGRFREDLYYRLAVVEVALPPLRERLEDLELLVPRLLAEAPFQHTVTHVHPDVLERFSRWTWPGNIRELRNTLLRALPFVDGPVLGTEALSATPNRAAIPPSDALPLKAARELAVDAFERNYLEQLLVRHGGDHTRVAVAAGLERRVLARLLDRHGLR